MHASRRGYWFRSGRQPEWPEKPDEGETADDIETGPKIVRDGPFLSINFGDDLLNPAELGLTEAAMAGVKTGTAILIPAGPGTYGHQTLGHPEVWGPALESFMAKLPEG